VKYIFIAAGTALILGTAFWAGDTYGLNARRWQRAQNELAAANARIAALTEQDASSFRKEEDDRDAAYMEALKTIGAENEARFRAYEEKLAAAQKELATRSNASVLCPSSCTLSPSEAAALNRIR